ncbi:MAG: patatin-like phospholipase family protein [Beijerinckiaceae bacterium]|nr:patatin-like phospholipase family protein [Beijerinckiaceae bacterium]
MDSAEQPNKPKCVLVLQGGGAMGAYHIGAFQAMREQAFEPDWVCGISMGSINGAIIAGNAPERRLEQLETFWETISWPSLSWPTIPWLPPIPETGVVKVETLEHKLSFATTLLGGQPGFFTPRVVNPYFAAPGLAATSFYDTAPLYETLAATVDFDRLNANSTRLSVGATDIETGSLIFFDTQKMVGRFGPEHVVASGSLPPGFPPTPIGGKFYWDGGCVSNSPLEAVQHDIPPGHSVIFIIDLWSAKGPAPDNMEAVAWRAKQIQYASATSQHVEAMASKLNLRHAKQLLDDPKADLSHERIDLVHVIYHPEQDQIPSSDAEFSRASIAERRKAGLADMRRALAESPWHRVPKPANIRCMVHRVTRDGVKTLDDSK